MGRTFSIFNARSENFRSDTLLVVLCWLQARFIPTIVKFVKKIFSGGGGGGEGGGNRRCIERDRRGRCRLLLYLEFVLLFVSTRGWYLSHPGDNLTNPGDVEHFCFLRSLLLSTGGGNGLSWGVMSMGVIAVRRKGKYCTMVHTEYTLAHTHPESSASYPLPLHVSVTLVLFPWSLGSRRPKRLAACSARPVPTTGWWSSPPRKA